MCAPLVAEERELLKEQSEEQLELVPGSNVRCFIYVGDDARIEEQARISGRITDALPVDDVRKGREVALISWSGDSIDAVALLTSGVRVAQLKRHITLSSICRCEPTSPTELAKHVPAARQESVARALGSGSRKLDADEAAAIRTAVLRIGGDLADAWLRLEALAQRSAEPLWREDGEPVLAYEREAVGLALDIGGFGRQDVLASWDGARDDPFVVGIAPRFKVHETAMLSSDMRVFGDWEEIKQSLVGAVQLEKGGRRLTIANVNATKIESSLGCDLIYYLHAHRSYVLVQYKRMRRAPQSRWEFRPSSDRNFDAQLDRMASITQDTTSTAPDAYRVGDGFCFVKFCESETDDPWKGELTGGMYLPLEYIQCLRSGNTIQGPRGGEVFRYDNVGRWINNTLFVRLVERAWVGTRGLTKPDITEVIRTALDANESVILATSTPAPRSS